MESDPPIRDDPDAGSARGPRGRSGAGEPTADVAPPPPEASGSPGRRRFLGLVAAAGGALAALVAAIPFLGVVLAPAKRQEERVWRDVGPVQGFPVGSTTRVTYPDPDPDPWSGLALRNAAWLRRESPDGFVAFSIYCTHTGCPVRWLHDADLFVCPCHGGVFDREGDVSAGPPPRPLDRPPVRVRDGRVEILTTGLPDPG